MHSRQTLFRHRLECLTCGRQAPSPATLCPVGQQLVRDLCALMGVDPRRFGLTPLEDRS